MSRFIYYDAECHYAECRCAECRGAFLFTDFGHGFYLLEGVFTK